MALLQLATAGPVAAQQLVAAIVTGDLPRYRQAHATLETIVRNAGFDEAKLKIFAQTPNSDTMSLTNAIRRSVAAGANLVITYGTSATLVAAQEVTDVPVLFADVYDPVGLNIVQNLAAPGVNRSGASCTLDPKGLLGNLLKIAPQVKTIGAMYCSGEAGSRRQLEDLTAAAKELGLYVISEDAKNAGKVDSALNALSEKADALFLTESVIIAQKSAEIIKTAQDHSLPVFSQTPGLVSQGALLGIFADPDEQGKLVAVHALQVLAGQKAFLLPIRETKKPVLIINLKTAEYLGLKIPQEVLTTAAKIVR
jgi:putative tryptophan/tyrosine transport system substrate-binding protein